MRIQDNSQRGSCHHWSKFSTQQSRAKLFMVRKLSQFLLTYLRILSQSHFMACLFCFATKFRMYSIILKIWCDRMCAQEIWMTITKKSGNKSEIKILCNKQINSSCGVSLRYKSTKLLSLYSLPSSVYCYVLWIVTSNLNSWSVAHPLCRGKVQTPEQPTTRGRVSPLRRLKPA